MAITQAICTSFKKEILQATHNFTSSTGNTFKIALYPSTATLDATSATYSSTGECPNSGNYSTGGNTLTIETSPASPGSSGTTVWADFQDTTWSASTITARGALIYNSSASNKSVVVLDFSPTKSVQRETSPFSSRHRTLPTRSSASPEIII